MCLTVVLFGSELIDLDPDVFLRRSLLIYSRQEPGQLPWIAFTLDASEPGAAESLISIDNIRVHTSTADNTGSVMNNCAQKLRAAR